MSPSLIISKSSIHQEWREKNIFAGSPSLNKKQSLNHLKLLKFEDSETLPFVNSPKINHSPKFERNIQSITKLSRCDVVSANIWVNNTNILAAWSPPLHIWRWKKSISFRMRLQQNQVFFVCFCVWCLKII